MITLDGVPLFPGVFARTNDCCYALHKLTQADVTWDSLYVTMFSGGIFIFSGNESKYAYLEIYFLLILGNLTSLLLAFTWQRINIDFPWSLTYFISLPHLSCFHSFPISKIGLCIGVLFVPIFPGQFRFYGFYRSLSRCPHKFGSGRQISRFFSSHRNTFLRKHINVIFDITILKILKPVWFVVSL
jgi:hypothetical protein